MKKTLLIMTKNILYTKKLFEKNNIEFQEWLDKWGEYEIRVYINCLNKKQIKFLKYEFNIKEPINEYKYLTFWS